MKMLEKKNRALFFSRCRRGLIGLPALLLLGCCQTAPLAPLHTAPNIDLTRYMGRWYVIASIPTFIEKNAYNAVESYRLDKDGVVLTTFTFREGGFDGKEKTYHPRGYVMDHHSNATWGMQFIWPIKADYRVLHIADDYGQTIVGRQKRDYVWIMARTPTIPDDVYERLLKLVAAQGYDIGRIRKVPQKWPH